MGYHQPDAGWRHDRYLRALDPARGGGSRLRLSNRRVCLCGCRSGAAHRHARLHIRGGRHPRSGRQHGANRGHLGGRAAVPSLGTRTGPGVATSPQATAAPPKFTRSLSGFGVVVLTLSFLSPGVSIFVSGGTIIQQAGSAAIAAFLLGTLINYCQTSMAAELGSAYPTAGYDYAAVGYAIGDWAAGTTYIAGVFSLPLFLNTSAVGIAIYLRPLF